MVHFSTEGLKLFPREMFQCMTIGGYGNIGVELEPSQNVIPEMVHIIERGSYIAYTILSLFICLNAFMTCLSYKLFHRFQTISNQASNFFNKQSHDFKPKLCKQCNVPK